MEGEGSIFDMQLLWMQTDFDVTVGKCLVFYELWSMGSNCVKAKGALERVASLRPYASLRWAVVRTYVVCRHSQQSGLFISDITHCPMVTSDILYRTTALDGGSGSIVAVSFQL